MKQLPAVVHATLAVGSVATAPYYDINISQTLCTPACADETPVFAPQFSVISIEPVGTNQYAINMHVEGIISYVPCGCNCCNTKTQVVSQNFSIPVYSTTAVTGATITQSTTQNLIVRIPCSNCSREFVSETPITITITTA